MPQPLAVGLMTAVRPDKPGDPADLRAQQVAIPQHGHEVALVRVHAAGVNRSDVLACRGILAGPFPRVLGRDYAGTVIAGPSRWNGRRVWGAGGGDLGVSRDGTHGEYVAIPVGALTPLPPSLTFVEAAASALAYFTASEAMRRVGADSPRTGTTIVVAGAAGSIGGAVCQLAAWHGMHVLAVVRSHSQAAAVRKRGFRAPIRGDQADIADQIRNQTHGRGADYAIDAVGGHLTEALLAALADGGALCVFSSPGRETISLEILDYYRRDLVCCGLNTARLSMYDAARTLQGLADGFANSALAATKVRACYPLNKIADAYLDVEHGRSGRRVVVPDDKSMA
jgi:NADPH:quinone reductase